VTEKNLTRFRSPANGSSSDMPGRAPRTAKPQKGAFNSLLKAIERRFIKLSYGQMESVLLDSER
jgi:hypothetical protein